MNELDKAYTQGFVDKCAEAGVDPELVVKHGQMSAPNYVPRAQPVASNRPVFLSSLGGLNDVSGAEYIMRRRERLSARALRKMPSGTELRKLRRSYQQPTQQQVAPKYVPRGQPIDKARSRLTTDDNASARALSHMPSGTELRKLRRSYQQPTQ